MMAESGIPAGEAAPGRVRGDGLRVGYVMSRFPKISETFILREMTELTNRGVNVEVLPLLPNRNSGVVHEEATPFVDRMTPIEIGSRDALSAWRRLVVKRPYLALRLVREVAAGYRKSPRDLPKALAVLVSGALLAERATELRLDRIHAHFATYPALAAWAAHRISGVPYSVTVHAHDIYMTQAMMGPKLAEAETVVTISKFNVRHMEEHAGPVFGPRIAEKCRVIHCGIRVDDYVSHGYRDTPVAPGDPLRITCVGSLEEYKGQAYLIESLCLLRARGVPVNVIFVGGGPDLGKLQSAAAELQVTEMVEFTGPVTQDRVREILSSTDCYVQPSVIASTGQMEGIPVALMEALAAGLPVVTTRISGIPELVRDTPEVSVSGGPGSETGRLATPRNAESLADAIEQVARDLPEAYRRARNGRELIEQEFDLRRVVDELIPVLSSSNQ